VPLSALPGMAERTVKVGSAGKIFSLTGWKVGWIVAPPSARLPISKAHQYVAFATPPNLQAAVAYGLGKERRLLRRMRAASSARDDMAAALEEAGFATLPAEGTYFLSSISPRPASRGRRDLLRARRARGGRGGDPGLAFYDARIRWTTSSASASPSMARSATAASLSVGGSPMWSQGMGVPGRQGLG
jgi:aspartate/methionine/tyrosine aminotransferase